MSIAARRTVTPPAVRVFRGISKAWRLDFREEMRLLGLPRPVWSKIARGSPQALTTEALRRIAFLARVFEAINMLFPPERADRWIRAPNAAPIFGARSALDLMVEAGPPGVRAVRLYLQGYLYG
nr:antitoxin Xre/MbcA/ParS toxin-binding domain-containing protein [uncultured Sphingomonas sp.]